ncbi:hypothetical protein [Oceanidesulfovibrio marinus]|uniref:hypothetical protein n=1 Tax=Oceanidesulfovibrio marinus TaxID=370038 RepID=UPI001185BB67|nr:hypothetical protein [Oceanidesulfovibrio marinus]
MEKFIKDGMVAVLVSPEHGFGWSTDCEQFSEELLFDKDLVALVLDGKLDEAQELAEKRYDPFDGSASGLEVFWVPQGTAFYVNECDGWECICYKTYKA